MITVKQLSRAGDKGLTLAKLQAEFARVRGAYVKAGVLGTAEKASSGDLTNAQLASIHEYGLGNVPARPWIGPPFRANREKYLGQLRTSYKKALKEGKPEQVTRTLALIGQQMTADIKNYVSQGEGVPPPNTPETIARKGSSRTLVDTGAMVNSVTYQVGDGSTPK